MITEIIQKIEKSYKNTTISPFKLDIIDFNKEIDLSNSTLIINSISFLGNFDLLLINKSTQFIKVRSNNNYVDYSNMIKIEQSGTLTRVYSDYLSIHSREIFIEFNSNDLSKFITNNLANIYKASVSGYLITPIN
ncbi:MAG: hypothetical protein JXR68_12115 [Bacteroidales bacterium]|nr:hypothetical protein [Bacteroidales bacterium]